MFEHQKMELTVCSDQIEISGTTLAGLWTELGTMTSDCVSHLSNSPRQPSYTDLGWFPVWIRHHAHDQEDFGF